VPRIAFGTLQDEFELSGEYQAFRGWAEGLAAAGCSARLFSPGGERLRGAGYTRLPAGEFPLRKILEQWRLADQAARLAPEVDIIHLFLPMPDCLWIGDRVKERTGKPVVVTCLGERPELEGRQWLALLRRSFRFYAVRGAAALLSPASRFLCDRYLAGGAAVAAQLRKAGCPEEKLQAASHRLPAEPPPDERSLALARELGVRPTFLYMGHFLPNKGVDVLLRAFAELEDAEARLMLVWSGLGDLEAVRRRARELGVEDRVRVVEHTVHRSTVLAGACALVLPFTASFGQVSPPILLLEAFRAGVPLILSRSASTREFDAGGRLWTVTPGDWRSLKERMALVLREPAAAAAMRAAQRRSFAAQAGAFDVAEFYGGLAGGPRG
jgi:glycosyltransferase involved in cell wall biosynthesis